MTTKEKVFIIAKGIANWKCSDAELLAAGLTEADLDRLWAGAEKVLDKALHKRAVKPTGEALDREIQSWIDYYTWED